MRKTQIDTKRINIRNFEDEIKNFLNEYNSYFGTGYKTVSELVNFGNGTLVENNGTLSTTIGEETKTLDLKSGYLLEFDVYDDIIQLRLNDNKKITVKSPENLGENINDAGYSFISKYLIDVNEAIQSPTGYNNKGVYYTEYIDLESFAKMWLVKEYSVDWDAAVSLYMYKDTDKIKAGPVWDFDNAFWREREIYNTNINYNVLKNGGTHQLMTAWLTKLMNHKEFLEQLTSIFDEYSNYFNNRYMSSLAQEQLDEIKGSINMNFILWSNQYSDSENLN